MSIYNTLQTAVSGMAAQANRLSTIGDNIANSSTTGYKDANVEFETVLGNEATNNYDSGGVQSRVRYNVTQQGEFTASSSVTDLAIKGNGYFLVQTPAGATALTRAGAFVPDANGNLVNTGGFKLMGYNLADGSYSATSDSGTLKAVNISTQALIATPSSAAALTVNLPSTATAVAAADLPSTNSATATYTDKTSMVAYDNLGTPVTLDIYLTNTGANTWEASVYNQADAASGGGFPYTSGPLDTENLTFDGTTGKLASGSPTALSVAVPNGKTVSIDLSDTTQLAAAYSVSTSTIDGNAPSRVSSISVGTDGTIFANYQNGASNAIYKIPLGDVESPDNMTSLTGNIYEPSQDSGTLRIGSAKTGVFGEIDSNQLENSTVDLATELTLMISTQRSYEANSKVLTTGSDMLSTIIQAIHN